MFQTDDHIKLCRLILSVVPVVRIYRLAYTTCVSTDSYFLLLIVNKSPYDLYTLKQIIEMTCFHLFQVTAMVIDTEQFKSWLLENNNFAVYVKLNALPMFEDLSFEIL